MTSQPPTTTSTRDTSDTQAFCFSNTYVENRTTIEIGHVLALLCENQMLREYLNESERRRVAAEDRSEEIAHVVWSLMDNDNSDMNEDMTDCIRQFKQCIHRLQQLEYDGCIAINNILSKSHEQAKDRIDTARHCQIEIEKLNGKVSQLELENLNLKNTMLCHTDEEIENLTLKLKETEDKVSLLEQSLSESQRALTVAKEKDITSERTLLHLDKVCVEYETRIETLTTLVHEQTTLLQSVAVAVQSPLMKPLSLLPRVNFDGHKKISKDNSLQHDAKESSLAAYLPLQTNDENQFPSSKAAPPRQYSPLLQTVKPSSSKNSNSNHTKMHSIPLRHILK